MRVYWTSSALNIAWRILQAHRASTSREDSTSTCCTLVRIKQMHVVMLLFTWCALNKENTSESAPRTHLRADLLVEVFFYPVNDTHTCLVFTVRTTGCTMPCTSESQFQILTGRFPRKVCVYVYHARVARAVSSVWERDTRERTV